MLQLSSIFLRKMTSVPVKIIITNMRKGFLIRINESATYNKVLKKITTSLKQKWVKVALNFSFV